MSTDLSPTLYDERLRLALMDAAAGYGYAAAGYGYSDLVVRYGIAQDLAKLLVWSAEARRKARQEMEG